MARVQSALGARATLPGYFTGHGNERSVTDHQHLSFAFDPSGTRLLVLAPHLLGHRTPTREEAEHLSLLDAALGDFRELRAGPAGILSLQVQSVDKGADPLFGPARTWETVTPYQATRHRRLGDPSKAVVADVLAECHRQGLPRPSVTASNPRGVPGLGLTSEVTLAFEVAVSGPLILGRSRHFGGGLFARAR
jgi:CRISPR-associated protein Csb2